MQKDNKTYSITDLVEAYRQFIRYQNNENFQYHVENYRAMSKAFGIFFENKIPDRVLEDYRNWFERSIMDSLKSLSPFNGLLEAPKHIIKLFKSQGGHFKQIEDDFMIAHRNFQIHLVELMFGKVEKSVTSDDLLENGFDDRREAPDPFDYS